MRLAALLLLVLITGCRRANGKPEIVSWEDRLREVAGFQLECDPESLQIVKLGREDMAGVIGCEKRATYVYAHDRRNWFRADQGGVVLEEEAGWPGRRR